VTHARRLAAPADRVGALLGTLGGAHDRLWPTDRWPGLPLRLDRPVGVGARGGHGAVRYAVVEYEPGRRLLFRFAPGTGLHGVHGFRVEALGPGRSRLVHELDARLSGAARVAAPLIRRMHDALLVDLLDRAEREVSGSAPRRPRPAAWMRALSRLEAAATRPRRPAGAAGTLVITALLALAGLHAAWALGWRWPGGDDAELARRVVGGDELPPDGLIWLVALALAAAAAILRARAHGSVSRAVRVGAALVAAALLVRGAGGIVIGVTGGPPDLFTRLDLAVYSPLCLLLGFGALRIAHRVGM
jgi:hypothetical protein